MNLKWGRMDKILVLVNAESILIWWTACGALTGVMFFGFEHSSVNFVSPEVVRSRTAMLNAQISMSWSRRSGTCVLDFFLQPTGRRKKVLILVSLTEKNCKQKETLHLSALTIRDSVYDLSQFPE